jgi:hypothetical protein
MNNNRKIVLEIKTKKDKYCSEDCPQHLFDGKFNCGCCRINLTHLERDKIGDKRTITCKECEIK